VALLALVMVAGCSTGNDDDGVISVPSRTPATTSAATPSPSGTATCTPAFSATTAVDRGTGSGPILGLRSAAGASHPGYDRVVFTLGGTGRPGWEVSYIAHPSSDGSGNPVAVQGSFFLQVLLRNVGYPGDTGVPEPTVRRFTPSGTTVVREVVLDGVYEGQYTAFVGLTAKRPFRVFQLAGPPRVVVDVRQC
jgi:hypothetical protein